MRLFLFFIVVLVLAGCENESSEQLQQQLFDAAETGNVELAGFILPKIDQVDTIDACYWTPLMKAALNGHLGVVQQLLDKGANIHARDKGGYTALMLAASNNHVDVVGWLIQKGAEVNHIERTQGWSALIWAANRGHSDMVRLLLDHGADPNLRGNDGKSARDWAIQRANAEIVNHLRQLS